MRNYRNLAIGILVSLASLLMVSQAKAESLSVHFTDINLQPGETKEMVVSYDTDYEDLCGFQIEFTLPSGIHLANAKLADSYSCPENYFGFNPDRDGTSVIMCGLYNSSDRLPSGHQDFLVLTFQADTDVEEHTYEIATTRLEFVHWDGNKSVKLDSQTFHITIGTPAPVKPGDVNGDGEANITDVALMVNHILGISSSDFNKAAADVNGDGEVNVTDVMLVVDTILNGEDVPDLELSATAVEVTEGSATVEITSGSGNYELSISNPDIIDASLEDSKVIITSKVPGTMDVEVIQKSSANAPRKAPAVHHSTVTVRDRETDQTADINVTITEEENLICPDDNHPHMIDLGLPSGTKWSCCNVGADKPENFGGYYAWGETGEKEEYKFYNYNWFIGDYEGWIGEQEYAIEEGWIEEYEWPGFRFYDESFWLSPSHNISGDRFDAAYVNWGSPWQMPSKEQFQELLDNCTYEPADFNGQNGVFLTGPNGNGIFLPYSGYKGDETYGQFGVELNWDGTEWGCYWTGDNYYADEYEMGELLENWDGELEYIPLYMWGDFSSFYSITPQSGYWGCEMPRYNGLTVRPIYHELKPFEVSTKTVEIEVLESTTVEITSCNGGFDVYSYSHPLLWYSIEGNTLTITGTHIGEGTITLRDNETNERIGINVKVTESHRQLKPLCPDDNHPHLIDLGLSVKWSCCNVGADKPESHGGYYAWGETMDETEKNVYDISTYTFYDEASRTFEKLGDIAGTEHDVAHVKWGGNWQMPTYNQNQELVSFCAYEWKTINGVSGGLFTGKNGAAIFIPAAGYREGSELFKYGEYGDCWLGGCYFYASMGPTGEELPYILSFGSTKGTNDVSIRASSAYFLDPYHRSRGLTVRPISQ